MANAVGGVYHASAPTYTDGQATDFQFDNRGNLQVSIVQQGTSGNSAGGGNPADGSSNSNFGFNENARAQVFNGVTWDRQRGNVDTGALITAAAVTSTQTGADQTNYNGRGLIVVLDMTTVGTGSVTLEIDGKDTASGKYFALLTGAAVVTNSTNVYTVYPGNAVAANVSASTVLPRTWRVKVTANNANATTYTVGASVIV